MNSVAEQTYPFSLSALPFEFEALEPLMDAQTLHLHHGKHHAGYVDKLNQALQLQPKFHDWPLARLLQDHAQLPTEIQKPVLNNGGGHLNHDLFWSSLTSPSQADLSSTSTDLTDAVKNEFESLENFKTAFGKIATEHFASGWVALAYDNSEKKLLIVDLPNHQVTPPRQHVIFICDVWEHAYYLHYQQRRNEFINAFWKLLDWNSAGARFNALTLA
jgi:superoxide dismutase, Fe-Mn family